MLKEVKYNENVTFVGRNGQGKCSGLEILSSTSGDSNKPVKIVTPLTSKGMPAHCLIEIPDDKIGELCVALQADVLSLVLDRLEQCEQVKLLGISPALDSLLVKQWEKK
jgi:hypothetical protein